MSEITERLIARANELGLKQTDLIKGTGAGKTTVHKWFNHLNDPSAKYLDDLSKTLKTTTQWLLTGREPSDNTQSVLDQIRALDNVRVDYGDDDDSGIRIPIYDVYFCCGDGDAEEFAFEEIKGDRIFPPHFFTDKNVKPENFKLVCAKNDSQKPYINEHDMVGIDISDREIKDGEMYAILLDGERMFKRIFREPGNVLRLHCYNPDYPDKIVTADNHSSLVIVGREMYRAG
nr:S24 family peptidase [Moraxella sp.]